MSFSIWAIHYREIVELHSSVYKNIIFYISYSLIFQRMSTVFPLQGDQYNTTNDNCINETFMVNTNTKTLELVFVPPYCTGLLLIYKILASFLSLQLLWHLKDPLPYHYIISILQNTLAYKLCNQISI